MRENAISNSPQTLCNSEASQIELKSAFWRPLGGHIAPEKNMSKSASGPIILGEVPFIFDNQSITKKTLRGSMCLQELSAPSLILASKQEVGSQGELPVSQGT